jgi:hypothetical protein
VADVELRRILRLVSARSLNTVGRAVLNATVLWELYARTQSKLVLAGVGLAQVIPVVALFVPDTMEIADYREGDAQSNWRRSLVVWQPSLVWCALVASTAVVALVWISRVQEFLYYQF